MGVLTAPLLSPGSTRRASCAVTSPLALVCIPQVYSTATRRPPVASTRNHGCLRVASLSFPTGGLPSLRFGGWLLILLCIAVGVKQRFYCTGKDSAKLLCHFAEFAARLNGHYPRMGVVCSVVQQMRLLFQTLYSPDAMSKPHMVSWLNTHSASIARDFRKYVCVHLSPISYTPATIPAAMWDLVLTRTICICFSTTSLSR